MKQLITLAVVIAALSSIAVAQQREKHPKPQRQDDVESVGCPNCPKKPVSWGFVLLTDSSGTNTIKAKPLSRTDGNVTLKMRNGHVLTVALSKFSKADRDLLSETFTKKPEECGYGYGVFGERPCSCV